MKKENTKWENFLLLSLMEECAEVAQRCSKAIKFGLKEKQLDQNLTNNERLIDELEDLYGVAKVLQDEESINHTNFERVLAKKPRLEKYFKYSQSGNKKDLK